MMSVATAVGLICLGDTTPPLSGLVGAGLHHAKCLGHLYGMIPCTKSSTCIYPCAKHCHCSQARPWCHTVLRRHLAAPALWDTARWEATGP